MTGRAIRSFRRSILGPAILAAALLAWLPAGSAMQLAQGAGGAPGNLNSQAIGKLPEGLPMEIVVFDDSEANLEIRDSLAEALSREGYLLAEEAPLELTFESQILEPGVQASAPSLGQIRSSNEADVGNRGSARGVEAEVNVWSSTKDSLLGGRQDTAASSSHSRLHINLRLRDRDRGKVIWQGDAVCEMLTSDRGRLLRAMAEPLAAALGKTLAGVPFDIR